MYVLWARGNATVDFKPKKLTMNKDHKHGQIGKTEGLHKLQLLRPDKIEITEK